MKNEAFKSVEPPVAYACYSKDLDVRMRSTSGGVFSVIATEFLKQDGIIYGAAFDSEFNVIHIRSDSIEDLDKLRGSKYPQSKSGIIYQDVKQQLNMGKLVLFTGTPCQIAALHSFLGKQYNNLWCLDFVCHGVASPGAWMAYLDQFEDRQQIKSIFFKSKIVSWKKWRFEVCYKERVKRTRGYMNPFMRSFLVHANIRPSCFQCRFKGLNRPSDFTISDCWGIGEENKRLNDDKGLSALLLHSDRAVRFFDSLKDLVEYEEYDPYVLMEGNFTTFYSLKEPEIRKAFFEMAAQKGFGKAYKKFFVPSFGGWLKYYFLCLVGKEK